MYLMIKNPGVADYRAFTLIGASGTRFANRPGTIGQFGSGSKLSIALLLRNAIRPVVYAGNLRMEPFAKPETVNGATFNRVCVKYDGKDLDGASLTRTDELGFVLEWGVQDWTKLTMALREFVSNAIDGAIANGGTYKDVQIDVVEKPRAQKGSTAVYLPYTSEVEDMYVKHLNTMFLHFGQPENLDKKILPKQNAEKDEIRIYKKGVLVSYLKGVSVFDYNLGDELTLDESRNATEWDVQFAAARAMGTATAEQLATVMQRMTQAHNVWEASLSTYTLTAALANRKEIVKQAWEAVAGDKGVLTPNCPHTADFVNRKGLRAVSFAETTTPWNDIVTSAGCKTSIQVLTTTEQKGREEADATPEMIEAVSWAWDLLAGLGLTNGKEEPPVKSFTRIMEAGGTVSGEYDMATGVVYLESSLGGKKLLKVAIEEVAHHITGAHDETRILQDFLFRVIMEMAPKS